MYLDKLAIGFACVALSGCSLFGSAKPTVTIVETPRTPLALSLPAPLDLTPPQWVVITPENASTVWNELTRKKVDLVLIGLTDNEYKQMALDYAKIRALVEEQRAIIIQYQQYYEIPK